MEFIFKWFWLFCIIITVFNCFILWKRTATNRKQAPELSGGYRRIFLWIGCLGVVPWIFLGLATLSGEVGSIFDVLGFNFGLWGFLFYLSILAIAVALFLYIFFFNGAQTLSEHRGILQPNLAKLETPTGWKFIAVFVALSQVFFVLILFYFSNDIQVDMCLDAGFSWDYELNTCAR